MNENDFKYVLHDFSSIALGARYSYTEIMENERVPFKLQSIMERYILPHTADPSQEIGSHILTITKENPCFRIYQNLKLKIKYYEPRKNKSGGYVEKKAGIEDFLSVSAEWDERYMMQEVIFSNLAVMAFHL